MDAKSVLEIDVNDEQFQAYLERYREYQSALEKLPDAWKAVGAGIAESTKAIGQAIADGAKATDQVTTSTIATAEAWDKSAASVVATNKAITDGINAASGAKDGADSAAKAWAAGITAVQGANNAVIGNVQQAENAKRGAESVANAWENSSKSISEFNENLAGANTRTDESRDSADSVAKAWGDAVSAVNRTSEATSDNAREAERAKSGAESVANAWEENKESVSGFNNVLATSAKNTGKTHSSAELITKAWQDGVAAIGAMNKSLDRMSSNLEKANKQQSALSKGAGAAKNFLNGAGKEAKNLATHIKDATTSLLSWGAVLGVFSGIIGAGGLFGINRMAASASQQRFTAMGLGTTTGGLNASAINFQSAVSNPVATLGSIRDAQMDLGKRWIFSAMGIKNPDRDPSELMPEMIKGARNTFIHNGSTAQGAEAAGLTNVFSLDDLNRFKHMSDSEIDAMAKRAQQDSKQLQVSDQVQKQWQDFNIQLQRSGITIENSFIRGLAPLAPQLSRLSDAFSGAIDTLLNSPQLGRWIDALSDGMKRFANYLTSPEFTDDVSAFMTGLGKLAHYLGRVVDLVTGKIGASDFLSGSGSMLNDGKVTDPKTGKTYVPGSDDDPNVWDFLKSAKHASGVAPTIYDKDFEAAAKEFGVSEKLLKAIAGTESNWDPNAVSKAGAQGLMQVMPSNLRKGQDPFNPHDNIMAAARVLRDGMANSGGDVDEALRYYNGGNRRGSTENLQYADRVHDQYRKLYGEDVPGPEIASSGVSSGKSEVLLQQILNALTSRPPASVTTQADPGTTALVSSNQIGGFYG